MSTINLPFAALINCRIFIRIIIAAAVSLISGDDLQHQNGMAARRGFVHVGRSRGSVQISSVKKNYNANMKFIHVYSHIQKSLTKKTILLFKDV